MTTSSHARLSPSDVTWTKCPGSISAQSHYEQRVNEYAADGKETHKQLSEIIESGKLESNHDRISIALSYLKNIDPSFTRFVEQRVTIGGDNRSWNKGIPASDWFGTADIVLHSQKNKCLEVIDYKDGYRFISEFSPQIPQYAAGVLNGLVDECEVDIIKLTIIQPRTVNCPIRSRLMPLKGFKHAIEEIGVAALATYDNNPPFNAGKHCNHCLHKQDCMLHELP